MRRALYLLAAAGLAVLLLTGFAGYGSGCQGPSKEWLGDRDAQNLLLGRVGSQARFWHLTESRHKVYLWNGQPYPADQGGIGFYRYRFERGRSLLCAFVNYDRPGFIRPCGANYWVDLNGGTCTQQSKSGVWRACRGS